MINADTLLILNTSDRYKNKILYNLWEKLR